MVSPPYETVLDLSEVHVQLNFEHCLISHPGLDLAASADGGLLFYSPTSLIGEKEHVNLPDSDQTKEECHAFKRLSYWKG